MRTEGTEYQTEICWDSSHLAIETGNDDARTDSAIHATLNYTDGSSTAWCLKPSDNGSFKTCGQTHPGVTWQPGTTNASIEPLNPGVNGSVFNTLLIELAQFPGFAKDSDNWDLQSITLTTAVNNASPGFPKTSTRLSLFGSTPVQSGSCFARFKHPGGKQVSSVLFNYLGLPVTVMDDDGPHTAPYCKE